MGRIKGLFEKLFPRKTASENFIQYIVRQFYVADSNGKPSITTTILMFVMTLVAVIAGVEMTVALSHVKVTAANGTVTESLRGISSEFMYLLIALSVVITKFNNDRAARQGQGAQSGQTQSAGADQPTTTAESIIDKAVGVVTKIKGGQ